MARPKKLNADYFSHDADMRNDPRIRALRRKFSHAGYAVWNYLLEVITDSDLFEVEWSMINIEILAGDFDVTPEQLTEITDYCIKLGLLQKNANDADNKAPALTCEKLKERFSELLNKRERNAKKGVSATETDQKGEFRPQKPSENRVSDGQNTQSKVKESKVKESKVNLSTKEEEKDTDGGNAALLPSSEILEVEVLGSAAEGSTNLKPEHEKAPHVAAAPPSDEDNPKDPTPEPKHRDTPPPNMGGVNFKRFQTWILKNAPQVARFKEPFTLDQFERLKKDFTLDEIQTMLLAMHNYKPLLNKNISANLTFRSWVNRDKQRPTTNGEDRNSNDLKPNDKKYGSMSDAKADLLADLARVSGRPAK